MSGGSFDHNLAGIEEGQGAKWDDTAHELVPADFAEYLHELLDVTGTASPIKGGLLVGDGTTWRVLPIDLNGKRLALNDAEELGVEWVNPASGGGGGSLTIQDDGVEVAINVDTINFGDNLEVTDLGGGDVLVDASASGGSGAIPDLLHVQDQKASGTTGGDFNSGAWRTRDLNTAVTNEITGASLASNQITLPAGTYEVEWSAPGYRTYRHATRLQDVTNATTLLSGTNEFASADSPGLFGQTRSFGRGRFTLASSAAIEIQHRCQATKLLDGFGLAAGSNFTVATEIYADIRIRQLS